MMIASSSSSSSSFDCILNGMEEVSLYHLNPNTIPIKIPSFDEGSTGTSNHTSTCHPVSSSSLAMSSKSFTWSDFPCYSYDEDDLMASSTSSFISMPTSSPSCAYASNTTTINNIRTEIDNDDDDNDNDISLSKLTFSLRDYIPRTVPPSPTSCRDFLTMDDTVIDDIPQSSSLPITTNPRRMPQQVSFAPLVRVRTHTIVLGDHPLCSGGMALQLGWESSPTQYMPLNTGIRSLDDGTHSWTMMRSTHPKSKRTLSQLRLNYPQRRQRLMELTGYTSAQLLHQEYLLVCCSGGVNLPVRTRLHGGDV